MVYDTRRREVKSMITRISPVNHYGKYLQVAPDGCVIVPMMVPDADLIRLHPRTGQKVSVKAGQYLEEQKFLPASVTLLPDGRHAIPQAGRWTFKACATHVRDGAGTQRREPTHRARAT